MHKVLDQLNNDKSFLVLGLTRATKVYQAKFDSGSTSEETLKELNWEVVEYSKLLEQSQHLSKYIHNTLRLLSPDVLHLQQLSRDFQQIQLFAYLKNIYKKKRQPAATHVLVVMVSEERRDKKPYAVPVQYVPYFSLRDQFVRELLQKVKHIMTENNMEVIGNVMKMHNFKALSLTSLHIEFRDFYTYNYAILVPFTSINTRLHEQYNSFKHSQTNGVTNG